MLVTIALNLWLLAFGSPATARASFYIYNTKADWRQASRCPYKRQRSFQWHFLKLDSLYMAVVADHSEKSTSPREAGRC